MNNYISPIVDIIIFSAEDIVMISDGAVKPSGNATEIGWADLT